jgi:hypothetical protein
MEKMGSGMKSILRSALIFSWRGRVERVRAVLTSVGLVACMEGKLFPKD